MEKSTKYRSSYVYWISLGLAISLLSMSACTQAPVLNFSAIRKSPSMEARENFVTTQSFSLQRDPNIYFIMFDTLRPDKALALNGAIKKFYDEHLTFETAYGSSTATWYSMYSLFHSSPGFLTYHSIPMIQSDTQFYGSLFLKVLRKLDYTVNSYGFTWGCDTQERSSGTSWARFMTTFFGWKTNLMKRCQTGPEYDDSYSHNRDELVVDDFETRLPQVITTPNKNFSFISLYNNHTPYKWAAAEGDPRVSNNVGVREKFSDQRTTINRYLNSVIASDLNFDRLMKLIKTLPGYDQAIIVLLSDHGEMLYEKFNESGHGGVPYREKIETLLAMRFPEEPTLKQTQIPSIASIEDIFPTVFDYMGISPEVDPDLITGKSLIKNERNSALVVQSNQENPTYHMVLINREGQKAWITVDENDFYNSSSFRLNKVTDLDDRSLRDLCDRENTDECRSKIKNRFPEALQELYPEERQ